MKGLNSEINTELQLFIAVTTKNAWNTFKFGQLSLEIEIYSEVEDIHLLDITYIEFDLLALVKNKKDLAELLGSGFEIEVDDFVPFSKYEFVENAIFTEKARKILFNQGQRIWVEHKWSDHIWN